MRNLMTALKRAFSSLSQPRMWLPLIAPVLISFLVWALLATFALHILVDWLAELLPFSWTSIYIVLWFFKLLAYLSGWTLIFAAAYLTSLVLAAIFALPILLRRIALHSYSDLALMGKDSFVSSAANSLTAFLGFAVGWVLTLPLWLIPGLSVILPFFWLAWLNRRTFSYDVLCLHASEDEWQMLRKKHARSLFLLGLGFAMLSHIPIIGILAPALAMLTYIHFGLEALRQLRGGAVVVQRQARLTYCADR